MQNGSWSIYHKLIKEKGLKLAKLVGYDSKECKCNLVLEFLYVVYA